MMQSSLTAETPTYWAFLAYLPMWGQPNVSHQSWSCWTCRAPIGSMERILLIIFKVEESSRRRRSMASQSQLATAGLPSTNQGCQVPKAPAATACCGCWANKIISPNHHTTLYFITSEVSILLFRMHKWKIFGNPTKRAKFSSLC